MLLLLLWFSPFNWWVCAYTGVGQFPLVIDIDRCFCTQYLFFCYALDRAGILLFFYLSEEDDDAGGKECLDMFVSF